MRSESEVAAASTELSPAIEVEGVSVVYHVRRSQRTVGRALKRLFSRGRRGPQRVVALDDVSLSVPRGSIFGVIGRNGAGKSTLLRAIAGIIPPSRGRITVRGEVTPLLSLGVGFNKQLTGRENIVLGTLAAGLRGQEADAAMQEIVEFSELGDFIDYPVRSYSSGIRSRLGFAVASQLDPEILLIDEALSVGDQAFKEKCRVRMEKMCGEGRTVVIVTHGMGTVLEMTSACLWLHEGRVARTGSPQEVVDAYMGFSRASKVGIDEAGTVDAPELDYDDDNSWGEGL